MKKFLKFLFSIIAIAAVICGAYYAYKNWFKDYLKKDKKDDEADDDFDDFDCDEDKDAREYVSINVPSEGENEENIQEAAQ